MATVQGPFSTLIEDYTGITDTDIIPNGQHRWYSNVPDEPTGLITLLIGDGTTQIKDLNRYLSAAPGGGGAGVPVGVVVWCAKPGTVPPSGQLWCDGAAVSRTDYAALFEAIGTTYGSGDGSTTFNVPDLRGVMPGAEGSQYCHPSSCR